MDKKIVKGIISTVAFVLAITFSAAAQAPNTMLYQGRLTDSLSGDPITSSTSATFYIYTTELAGVYIDSFIRTVNPDNNGVFTVELGPLSAVDFDGDKLWLEIRIGGVELKPRQLITSVPYAFTANVSNGSITETKLADNSVSSNKIVNYTITGNDIANSTITGTKIENSSLTQYDILDEPGICRTSVSGSVSISTSGTTIVDSASITVPAAGYVLAIGTGYGAVLGTSIGVIVACINSTTSMTTVHVAFGSNNESLSASAVRWGVLNPENLFTVASAGTYKYYFLANRGAYSDGNATIYYPKLDLIYIPTLYGSSTALVSGSEAANFEKAEAVNIVPQPDSPVLTTETVYKVDLLELELKAARAQAEAEKAERELMEAKMRQLQDNQEQ
ncbi:MAG: hypothetical protein JXA92_03520 [candidate division Zixibacteria bacterium]|nr:hypothetical protein [candidate division Zixibacteria bacterium]